MNERIGIGRGEEKGNGNRTEEMRIEEEGRGRLEEMRNDGREEWEIEEKMGREEEERKRDGKGIEGRV